MTTVTITHSCAQKFARMRIINPMLRSRDFLLLFWTFGLFRPLPLSWWRLEISPLETFSSGRRFNRRAGHFFPTHLNGLTRSKFSSASCGFTPFLRPSFCNPPLSCHFYLPLGRTYNYPSLYLLGGRFYNFLKFPNGKQNPKKSWGATCIPFDSEVHLFSCCVFKHLHWDFVWKWEEWMSPGRGCQRHNSVWVVEWTKPTVETRAEKLGMKLENESRVEKQPRTVENSRESWEKVEKVQNNFKNESWEQKLRKKLRSWEKVEKSWEHWEWKLTTKVENVLIIRYSDTKRLIDGGGGFLVKVSSFSQTRSTLFWCLVVSFALGSSDVICEVDADLVTVWQSYRSWDET